MSESFEDYARVQKLLEANPSGVSRPLYEGIAEATSDSPMVLEAALEASVEPDPQPGAPLRLMPEQTSAVLNYLTATTGAIEVDLGQATVDPYVTPDPHVIVTIAHEAKISDTGQLADIPRLDGVWAIAARRYPPNAELQDLPHGWIVRQKQADNAAGFKYYYMANKTESGVSPNSVEGMAEDLRGVRIAEYTVGLLAECQPENIDQIDSRRAHREPLLRSIGRQLLGRIAGHHDVA